MANRVIIACTLVLAAVYAYGIAGIRVPQLGDPLGPRAFPIMVCIGLVVAALLLTYETFVAKPAPSPAPDVPGAADDDAPTTSHRWVVPFTTVVTSIYFLGFEPLGYPIATSLFLIALTSVFRPGHWFGNIATAVVFSFTSYYVFTAVLHVRLPGGILPF